MRPEAMVTMRKPCYTQAELVSIASPAAQKGIRTMIRKMKKRSIKESSTPVRCGMPWNLAKSRRIMGNRMNSTARRTEGNTP
jgi:hypothetical protein